MPDQGPLVDAVIELDVGPPGHGGFCVARHEGRVIFVRHALPGERVRALVTEDRGGSFCRADAIDILRPSADRVDPPCAYAGPGKCGGCDWQHASGRAQREIKAAVVREQFGRLAGVDISDRFTGVEELPGGLLGWRTRITFAVAADGHAGLHRHRSSGVLPVDRCPLGVAGVGDSTVLAQTWRGLTGVEVAAGEDRVTTLAHRPGRGRQARGRRPPDHVEVLDGPAALRHRASGRDFTVAAGGFWQVHPAAADSFAAALLEAVDPRPGETVLDLYCGAGGLTAAVAEAVGPAGRVVGIEAAAQAVVDARHNLADLPCVEIVSGRIDAALIASLEVQPDVVVLDPPRTGLGREAMVALLEREPRAIGYVACDPAALARDVKIALDAGWQLARVRAFDAFPMTHHMECVASLLAPATEAFASHPGG